ncbi:MAG: SDR family oxidoreductase [Oscillospiraceae bacterium]
MKTALITGASGGIGGQIALTLSKEGYAVALVYNKGEERASELCKQMPVAQAFRCDVSDFKQVEELYSQVKQVFSSLDLVVNCAGVAYSGLVQDMTPEEIQRVIAVDLNGTIYSCKMAAEVMTKRHRGVIINISSVWGEVGSSCEAVYSGAKGGVISFTKALAKELAPSGVRVNCISPGVIKTPMLDCYSTEDLRQLAQQTPLNRLGTPRDVAMAVKFLCGDDAAFITGQNLVVDGGFAL